MKKKAGLRIGKSSLRKLPKTVSKAQLSVFVLVFGLIGFLLYKTFATAPLVATTEAEQMSLPTNNIAAIINDSSASAGKAVKMTANGTVVSPVNFVSSVNSVVVTARGDQCSGAPAMTVMLDGNPALSNAVVSSTGWTTYNTTPASPMTSGAHTLSISFNNSYTNSGHGKKGNGACSRNLYLDVTNFYGPDVAPSPAPTVSLSATPASVSAGASSTLNWSSTNATSCTSIGGTWTGTQLTSGTASTGIINQTTVYTLTCTGIGGSTSASATVSVSSFTTSLTNGMTITPPYTWTFNPGIASVKGYFWADGTLLGTATPNASGGYSFVLQSTTLTAGTHQLGHAWDLASGTHQVPPSSYTVTINSPAAPPPPPTSGTILDDTRAVSMTDLYSNGTPDPNNIYGTELNITTRQSPAGFWQGILFSNNDITLQPDPTFTKVYHMHVGPGIGISRNPWWDSAITHNADLNRMRPLQMGMYDWYAMAIKWETPYTMGNWACNMQFGYPVITSPAFCIGASSAWGGTPGMYLERNTGLVSYNSATGSWRAANIDFSQILPFSTYSNKWVRFVVGIKWGSNNDGEVHVLVRADGEASYHEVYTRTAVNTWQWGGAGNVPQNPGAGFMDNNKIDLYEGWDGALTDANMPNNYVDQTGYIRSNNEATAMSYFP